MASCIKAPVPTTKRSPEGDLIQYLKATNDPSIRIYALSQAFINEVHFLHNATDRNGISFFKDGFISGGDVIRNFIKLYILPGQKVIFLTKTSMFVCHQVGDIRFVKENRINFDSIPEQNTVPGVVLDLVRSLQESPKFSGKTFIKLRMKGDTSDLGPGDGDFDLYIARMMEKSGKKIKVEVLFKGGHIFVKW